MSKYIKHSPTTIHIDDYHCAEYILEFVSSEKIWDDYCRSSIYFDHSPIEYVKNYKFYSFRNWMLDKYHLEVKRGIRYV